MLYWSHNFQNIILIEKLSFLLYCKYGNCEKITYLHTSLINCLLCLHVWFQLLISKPSNICVAIEVIYMYWCLTRTGLYLSVTVFRTHIIFFPGKTPTSTLFFAPQFSPGESTHIPRTSISPEVYTPSVTGFREPPREPACPQGNSLCDNAVFPVILRGVCS